MKSYIDKTIINSKECFDIKLVKDIHNKFKFKNPINEIIQNNFLEKSGFYETSPMSIYQILNFGWMRFFELVKLYTSALETDKDECKNDIVALKQLIKRSVEASYIHQKFLDQKDRLEI